MRNIIEWFKNHSPLDYILVVLIILIGITLVKLPRAISDNSKHKAQFAAVYTEFNDEWNKREKAGTLPDDSDQKADKAKPKAESTDQLINNFLKAENELIDVYYAQTKGNESIDITTNVAYNNKLAAFKNDLVPSLSGGTSGMLFQDSQLSGYSLRSTKLTPKGNQSYDGIFTASTNGQDFAYITYTFDSKSNAIGNLNIMMKSGVIEKLRGQNNE